MNELIDKLKSNEENLDTTMAFKMNMEKKEAYVEFAVKHNLSMGKICREALDRMMEDLVSELEK